MHIKICGVTTPEDAELAARLGANAIGLNFCAESPRYVTADLADQIISRMPPFLDAVGVFVRPDFGALQNTVLSLRLRTLQLHDFPSDQWPELVHLRRGNAIILACPISDLQDRLRFEAELDRWQRKLPLVLKLRDPSNALKGGSRSPLELVAWLEEKLAPNAPAIAVLFDAKVPGQHGGTGQQAPWHLLADWQLPYPLILAGGLMPENVAEAIRIVRPYAVDVASGVETSPGVKDPEKLRRFIGNAREAAAKFLTS